MSWNLSYKTKADFYADEPDQVYEQEIAEDQKEIARKAAMQIFESGAIGSDKDYRITLGGHSNPNHEPRQNYSNDCIWINVNQI